MSITITTIMNRFHDWMKEAAAHPQVKEPTAMTLATLGADGHPNARIVLLKDADNDGFVFYTNTQSAKGRELAAHPHASLVFYWMPLTRQIRIRGKIQPVSNAEADAYFATRVHGKQIGAWASAQSTPLVSRQELEARIAELEKQYEGHTVPRPPHWSGYRLVPDYFEFWSEGEYRLHERDIFTPDGTGNWGLSHLYP